jgi:hypothetical protein
VPRYRREPSNRELRERVIAFMKDTRLFADVSVRLLADLLDRYDLVEVPPAPDQFAPLDPAVLAVPEGSVELYMAPQTVWPPPPMGVPFAPLAIPLATGIHLRNLGTLRGLNNWALAALRANGPDPVRILYLPRLEFDMALPRVLVNALDARMAGIVTA